MTGRKETRWKRYPLPSASAVGKNIDGIARVVDNDGDDDDDDERDDTISGSGLGIVPID